MIPSFSSDTADRMRRTARFRIAGDEKYSVWSADAVVLHRTQQLIEMYRCFSPGGRSGASVRLEAVDAVPSVAEEGP